MLGMAGAPGKAEIKGNDAGTGVVKLLDIGGVVIVVVIVLMTVVVQLGAAEVVLLGGVH